MAEYERAKDCFEALLVLASQQNLEMTRTKTAKLLYLADLRSVEYDGITGSGTEWRWREFGPFDDELIKIEKSLAQRGVITSKMKRLGLGDKKQYDLKAVHASSSLLDNDDDFIVHMKSVLDQYGEWTPTKLKKYTYNTAPMIEAQKLEKREELLDFRTAGHLSLADIDASTGKGPDYDSEECVFHASTGDFIESLKTRHVL